tara:strand:+ start:5638 stop:6333 length:696 start_codon:yes stop_codon:yes gene_type:complete
MSDSELSPELQELMADIEPEGPAEEPVVEETSQVDLVEESLDTTAPTEVESPMEPQGMEITPEAPPTEPVDLSYMERPEDYNFEIALAENRVDIASMPLADYQKWLFPPKGEEGHEEGIETLDMVWATLMAAGYEEEPKKVKVAATLWSRRHYDGETSKAARHILQRVPASKIVANLPPSMDVKTLEDISPVVVVPQIHETETTSKMGDYLPIAVFAGVAMLIPWHIMNKK